jgi:putative hemolysin
MALTIVVILLIVSVLIFFNALYVAGEFAAVSARRTRIIQLAEKGNRLAKMVLPVLQEPRRLDNYIAASQVGITLSSLVLGIYGERQIAPLVEPLIAGVLPGSDPTTGGQLAASGVAATLVLLLLTTLQVVMGELVPKSVAIRYPERLALLTALPMKWSADYILRPLIVVLNGSGALVLRLLNMAPQGGHAHVHSPEEILILVRESHEGGLIDTDERQLLQNIFRSSQTQAEAIAVPRMRIVAAPVESTIADVLALAANSSYTRIPIYEGDIDNIIGFVHLRDLFERWRSAPQGDLRPILRPVPFVPETLTRSQIWARLNETQSYLAIVIDEHGGTAGLITREDLLEELFGELQDEFDQERALIAPGEQGRIIVRGDMLIDRLNDLLDIELPPHTTHTVGGLIMEELDRVPRVGDVVEIGETRLQVETVAHRSVGEVSITLPPGAFDFPVGEVAE